MPTDVEKAYIAGFVDGEGCINIHKNSNGKSYTGRVMIGNTDTRVIGFIHDCYGGSIQQVRECKLGRSKPFHTLYLTGKNAVTLINDVLPYLQIKAEQARTVLELAKHMEQNPRTVKGVKGIRRVTQDMIMFRESLKTRINNLNHMGIGG